MFDTTFDFSMDYDFFMRAAATGANFVHLNEFLSSFRVHSSAKSSNLIAIGDQEHLVIQKRYLSVTPAYANLIKYYCGLLRGIKYIQQGDARYVFGGIARRIGHFARDMVGRST
jgi:hypothetical protein